MKRLFSNSRKGQSAIEYLMTYGWMLLVVAIVGGAVITTVQDTQDACEAQMQGLDSSEREFGVAAFSVTSDSLNVQFENNAQATVTVGNVTVGSQSIDHNQEIGFGDTTTVEFDNYQSDEEACSTVSVTVEYDRDGLDSELTGELQDQMTEA